MTEDEQVQRFADLFVGNNQAYGVGGEGGGAIHSPVSLDTYRRHLEGVEPIGIYPVRHHVELGRGVVGGPVVTTIWTKWGCCDIDTGDWSEAFLLATALRGMGMKPHIERSRSKGWHIWIFSPEWIEAKVMRRALKVAYMAIDLPAKEANPKSETLREGQLGNYVRLPYPGALIVTGKSRQTFMWCWDRKHDGEVCNFGTWIGQREEHVYTDVETLAKWASKWYEPPRPQFRVSGETPEHAKALVDTMPRKQRTFWTEGPKGDRSEALVALAHQLAKLGWNAQDVFVVLWHCPFNKYFDRPDGEDFVEDIVTRAFTR